LSEVPEVLTLRSDGDDHVVHASALWLGEDALVYLWGGTRPHIGAVASATPRPSLRDPARTSATASVFTYPGHKEDAVAKATAEALAAALDAKVVVTAGIHWDHLTAAAIRIVETRCRNITEKLIRELPLMKKISP
jgi:hypothetical protein